MHAEGDNVTAEVVPIGGDTPVRSMQSALLAAARKLYWFGCVMVPLLIVRVGSVTISDAMFSLSLLIAVLAHAGGDGRLPRPYAIGTFLGLALIYALSTLASSFGLPADDFIESLFAAGKFVYLLVFWFSLGVFVLRDERDIGMAALMWVIGVAISALGGIAQILIDPAIVPGTEVRIGRAVGFAEHPNDLGASSGIALGPAVALAAGALRFRLGRWLSGLCVPVIGIGLVLSASASGIIAAMLSVAFWLVGAARYRLALFSLGVVVVAIIGLGIFIQTTDVDVHAIADLYALADSGKTGTFAERIQTYVAALDYVSSSPLVGVGTAAGGRAVWDGLAVHNVIIGAWYETGLLGCLAVIGMYGMACWLSVSAIRLSKGDPLRELLMALVGAELAFLIYSLSAPGLYQRYGWISVALCIAALNVLVRRRRREHQLIPATGSEDR